jgi:hypothetical protein
MSAAMGKWGIQLSIAETNVGLLQGFRRVSGSGTFLCRHLTSHALN